MIVVRPTHPDGAAHAGLGLLSNTDPRLSDQRVPTDGSVTAAKIAAGGLPQSSVTNLVADLAAKVHTGSAIQTRVGPLVLQPAGDNGVLYMGPAGQEPDGRPLYSLMPGKECIRLTMTDPRGGPGHTVGGPVDFYIGPYVGTTPIGMAIEFKGIVETWCEDWSCHGNNRGGTGTPANPHFWVTDGMDDSALLITCHSELDLNPRTKWARIASISSLGTKGVGPIQMVLRDTLDWFGWGTTTDTRAKTITEMARLSSVGRLQLGQGVVGSAVPVRLHIGDPGGTAFRIQDTNNPSGGATSIVQAAQLMTLNTYDGAGTFTGTPLKISSAGVGFNNANPSRPTLAPAATDAASTQALANDIRAKLISMGLMA